MASAVEVKARGRIPAFAVLGLPALLAAALLLVSSAPSVFADHGEGHDEGGEPAPDVPLTDDDADTGSGGGRAVASARPPR